MADTKIALTEAAIAMLPTPPKGKNRIYRFADMPGLAVRITGNGKRHFLCCRISDALDSRGMRVEQRTSLGIEWIKGGGTVLQAKDRFKALGGAAPESRTQKAKRLRAEKQVSEREITVGKLIDRYITEWAKPNKKSWDEDDSRLNKVVRPVWGERKAKSITRADVDALVAPVAIGDPDNGISPRRAEANHRLAVVRKMFSFAVDKGIIDAHPCLRMKAPGGKIAPRQRALTTAKELRLLWRLTDPSGPWTKPMHKGWPRDVPWEARGRMRREIADALRLVLATGCRSNEAAGLAWKELDLDAGEWVLPAERSKNRRPNLVPLLPPVVEMLRERRELAKGDYVFPGLRAGTPHLNDKHLSEALRYACARLARIGLQPFTTHDLRRTVETGMAAAKVPKEYRDRVLNHVDASVGGKHYNVHDYADEKREALEKWARRLEAMLKPERDNVVPLRRAKP
ncbi:site-specific integrase [Lysobacter sp. CFH 32150]|uniref:tyrosine-type recombinase/integrase n=1 Tax=Lysobacter sp. CFH 32150 TaxID=2927128 RepID=UPI001FA73335|nr:site-specific integrase [Lysobacter sp. CFH 32150]MCI4567216.1 tyrosine-type recombinase/integrase [Lysobacter sp. CFH 32150]